MTLHAEPAAPFSKPQFPPESAVHGSGGDHGSVVRKLFRDNNHALIRFIASKVGSEAEAQDVAQEAYVRLLELDQPGTVSFMRAYLFRTASNLAIDHLRHRAVHDSSINRQTEFFEQLLTPPSPERAAISKQQLEQVVAVFAELPVNCRKACILHFFAERSIQQIATQLHLTERMIRYYLARGLAACACRIDTV